MWCILYISISKLHFYTACYILFTLTYCIIEKIISGGWEKETGVFLVNIRRRERIRFVFCGCFENMEAILSDFLILTIKKAYRESIQFVRRWLTTNWSNENTKTITEFCRNFGYFIRDLPTGFTSKTSVCNAVWNRLPSGPFADKKITHVAQERFSLANMAYTQFYIDYLHGKDPYSSQYLTNVA